jgi:hypothetical protein
MQLDKTHLSTAELFQMGRLFLALVEEVIMISSSEVAIDGGTYLLVLPSFPSLWWVFGEFS